MRLKTLERVLIVSVHHYLETLNAGCTQNGEGGLVSSANFCNLLITSCSREKTYQTLPAFSYCKRQKAGRGLGTRLHMYAISLIFPALLADTTAEILAETAMLIAVICVCVYIYIKYMCVLHNVSCGRG